MDRNHVETLESLQDYLTRIAYNLAINKFPAEDPEDLLPLAG